MKEFLIRREDGDFCLIHVNRFADVLRPNSIKSERIKGWGDYRIKIENCEIPFSFEEVGIQISFEQCEMADEKAKTITNEICQNVEKEIGKPCYWIRLSD